MVGGYTANSGANVPLWKALGYKSEQEYINATSGANGSKKAVTPLTGLGGVGTLPGATKIPSTVNTTVKMPTLQTAYGGLIGGGSSGGVTNEGVIIGNPNVNNDTFRSPTPALQVPTTIGGGTVTLPKTPSVATPTTPTAQKPTQSEETQPTGRTDEGSYNGTNSFLEWYKENYGTDFDSSVGFTRREGMNDGVWNVGKNLYDYYLQGLDDEQNRANEEENRNKYYDEQLESMLGEYASSRDALDKSKRQQQQNASITLDKLKKYLPTQIKSQGLGGLGVSESTMLQAYNNYNNDMGAIESDYQANKTSLDVGENNAKNTLENYRQDALQKIAEKYGAAADARQAEAGTTSKNIFSAYEAQVKEQMRQAFEDAYATISNSTSTSADEIMKYVESLRGKIDNEQLTTLQTQAQQIAANNLKAKEDADRENAYMVAQATIEELIGEGSFDEARKYLDSNRSILGDSVYNSYITSLETKIKNKETADKEEQEAKDKRITSGQEVFEYNGGHYQITSQLKSDANEIKRNNDFKNQLKEKCGTTDPYDSSKIPNGTTFEIKADNRGSNDFNFWDDVGAFLLSPFGAGAWDSWGNWNTLYVTYYNGQWYRSDKKV